MGEHVDSRQAFADYVAMASLMKQAEIAVALREPARQLIQILKNRSLDLAECAEIAADMGRANWGMF